MTKYLIMRPDPFRNYDEWISQFITSQNLDLVDGKVVNGPELDVKIIKDYKKASEAGGLTSKEVDSFYDQGWRPVSQIKEYAEKAKNAKARLVEVEKK